MINDEQCGGQKKKVAFYYSGKIKMQQIVNCPLRTTTRAIITGCRMQNTFWEDRRLGRIKHKKKNRQQNQNNSGNNPQKKLHFKNQTLLQEIRQTLLKLQVKPQLIQQQRQIQKIPMPMFWHFYCCFLHLQYHPRTISSLPGLQILWTLPQKANSKIRLLIWPKPDNLVVVPMFVDLCELFDFPSC